ncbi:hypothetical protein [Crateriforma conspicua]|uniref:Uncharacterized protein n=1 Tax=Crateriforma conspicua TaxID=2527996 RepID=A0A5C5YBS5_9PLAN|nr:hypothetical protein [Crateriforma conspicua]QDV61510.1 hypothetical protein Mal65_06350 [Crateriforma conspicua]TWT72243.1 hypothetical protein Pan14r_45610 [Crateriforma conspicua]
MTHPADATARPNDALPQDVLLGIGNFTVHFHWQKDRFCHDVAFGDQPLLQSVEGTGEDVWPDSAPLQQVSVESIGERCVALGVGASGTSHFSVSVEPESCTDDACTIRFEWACRSKEAPADPRSTYQWPAEHRSLIDIAAEPSTRQDTDGTSVCLRPTSESGPTYVWAYRVTVRRPVGE